MCPDDEIALNHRSHEIGTTLCLQEEMESGVTFGPLEPYTGRIAPAIFQIENQPVEKEIAQSLLHDNIALTFPNSEKSTAFAIGQSNDLSQSEALNALQIQPIGSAVYSRSLYRPYVSYIGLKCAQYPEKVVKADIVMARLHACVGTEWNSRLRSNLPQLHLFVQAQLPQLATHHTIDSILFSHDSRTETPWKAIPPTTTREDTAIPPGSK